MSDSNFSAMRGDTCCMPTAGPQHRSSKLQLAQHSSESCEHLRRALKPSCLAGLLAAFLVRAAQELSCIFLKKVGPVSDIDIGDIVTDGEEVVGHAAVKCAG